MTVTKKKLVRIFYKDLGLSLKESNNLLNRFIRIIIDNGQKKVIKISGFGSFYMKKTSKRVGRNPKTRETYIIEPMKKFTFNPSKKLKNKLN